MESFSSSVLIGGVAFFFLGLTLVRKNLQLAAGDKLRAALSSVSNNRFKAFGFGAFITFLFQSSTATSVLLISLADTHLLNLYQAIAILLGADFSTTFVVVLLSIRKITDLALVIFAAGFFLELAATRKKIKLTGSIVLSLGLIFYGMHLMVSAATPLKDSPVTGYIFGYLATHPLASILMAVVISAGVHSSGMIGIAIALAFAGTLSFEAAVPLVLGANVGTCIPAVLAAMGSGVEGKRVAAAHTVAKIFGVALVFPFIPQVGLFINKVFVVFSKFIPSATNGVAGKIALTHILFNIALVVIILPVISLLVYAVRYLIPEPRAKKEEFKSLYLDQVALETPAMAFAQAKREILRIASIAHEMFSDSLRMFSRGTDVMEEIERIESEDDKIDLLDKAVRFYLAELSTEKLSSEQGHVHLSLLSITTDLEEIGDTISKEMVMLAKKKISKQRIFSDEGWLDLKEFQQMIGENFNLMISVLTQPSAELAQKVYRHEEHIDEVEQHLRQSHINRLHSGLKESLDTSSIHLDILGSLRRINSKLSHIVRLATS